MQVSSLVVDVPQDSVTKNCSNKILVQNETFGESQELCGVNTDEHMAEIGDIPYWDDMKVNISIGTNDCKVEDIMAAPGLDEDQSLLSSLSSLKRSVMRTEGLGDVNRNELLNAGSSLTVSLKSASD